MTIFEQIREIPILDVLDMFGLKTKAMNGVTKIIDNWKVTDGWIVDCNKNLVNDFSKERGKGDQLAFVESYLKISNKEAVEWFKLNFNLYEQMETKNNIISLWNDLPQLTEEEIIYLESRSIDYKKVCDFVKSRDGVSVPIKDFRGNIINIKTRNLVGDIRFKQVQGASAHGVYMNEVNRDVKKLIVVEGMFDFLTIVQFFPNVIGLNTRSNGIGTVKDFYDDGFEILYIHDNDEAGEESAADVLDKMPNAKILSIAEFGEYKDINEFFVKTGKNPINEIKERAKKFKNYVSNKINLISYDDVLELAEKEIQETDPRSILGFGYKFLDGNLGGIFKGDLVLLGGITGTGKTTLAMNIGRNIAKKGGKVIVLALESRLVKIGQLEILRELNKNRKQQIKTVDWLKGLDKATPGERRVVIDKLKGSNIFYLQVTEKVTIEDLEPVFKKGADLFIFDHLHYFGIHRGDMSKADAIEQGVQGIKELTVKYETRTILIAHFKKLDESQRPTMTDFKDSISIAQTADTILLLWRDKSLKEDNPERQYDTEFISPKNRIDTPSFTAYARYQPNIYDYVEIGTKKFGTDNSEIKQTQRLWDEAKNVFNLPTNF
jgi:replicative DNA helicase